jgi:hypothetical protein
MIAPVQAIFHRLGDNFPVFLLNRCIPQRSNSAVSRCGGIVAVRLYQLQNLSRLRCLQPEEHDARLLGPATFVNRSAAFMGTTTPPSRQLSSIYSKKEAVIQRNWGDPAKLGLIASAPATAHTASAGRRLPREVDVLVQGILQGVTIRPHGVVGQGAPFPGLNGCAARNEQGQAGKHRHEEYFHYGPFPFS